MIGPPPWAIVCGAQRASAIVLPTRPAPDDRSLQASRLHDASSQLALSKAALLLASGAPDEALKALAIVAPTSGLHPAAVAMRAEIGEPERLLTFKAFIPPAVPCGAALM